MYYCFLNEDLNGLEDDPLVVQKEYAKRLGMLCVVDLTRRKVSDGQGNLLDLTGHKVILRSSYDNMIAGVLFLQDCGAVLVETEEDIRKIEDWFSLGLTRRKFWNIQLSDIEKGQWNNDLYRFLNIEDRVFLKSVHKGFTIAAKSSRILKRDQEIIFFLRRQCEKYGTCLLLTAYNTLKTDSIGTRESRHVVMNGHVINSSRFVKFVKHITPRSHINKAYEIVETINTIKDFPQNYVLDLGEFLDRDKNAYVDIVELNPLSCSMCYVNNSIFTVTLPEIEKEQRRLLMGPEYCYDAISNPRKYQTDRTSNRRYSYESLERYDFL